MKFCSIIFIATVAMTYGASIKRSNPVCDFCVSSINLLRSDETLLESSTQSNQVPQVVMNLIQSEKSAEMVCALFEQCDSAGHINDDTEYDETTFFDVFKGGRNRRNAIHIGGKIAISLICRHCGCC